MTFILNHWVKWTLCFADRVALPLSFKRINNLKEKKMKTDCHALMTCTKIILLIKSTLKIEKSTFNRSVLTKSYCIWWTVFAKRFKFDLRTDFFFVSTLLLLIQRTQLPWYVIRSIYDIYHFGISSRLLLLLLDVSRDSSTISLEKRVVNTLFLHFLFFSSLSEAYYLLTSVSALTTQSLKKSKR